MAEVPPVTSTPPKRIAIITLISRNVPICWLVAPTLASEKIAPNPAIRPESANAIIFIFFTGTPTHEPGTVFSYDTGCSQVLAALVLRLSGQQVIDYLQERLFLPLGATDEKNWLRDPSGCCQGGTGLCMSLRDMHAVAQCILDGGRDG